MLSDQWPRLAEAASWPQTVFRKTELGHCPRTPAQGPCECDLVLTCSKFLTTSDYAPRLRARFDVERQLIDDPPRAVVTRDLATG